MMQRVLGMPLTMAMENLSGREVTVLTALPPRRPDKQGSMRVVRAQDNGGAVTLTVSPFEDTLEEEP